MKNKKLIILSLSSLLLTGCAEAYKGPQDLLNMKGHEGEYVYNYFFGDSSPLNGYLMTSFVNTFETIAYTVAIASLLITGVNFMIHNDEKSVKTLKLSVAITVCAFILLKVLPTIIKWLIVR